jgi:hypothetical protein
MQKLPTMSVEERWLCNQVRSFFLTVDLKEGSDSLPLFFIAFFRKSSILFPLYLGENMMKSLFHHPHYI